MDIALTRSQFALWRAAIFAVFLSSGLSITTWASRVPDIKAALGLNNGEVGMVLLCMGLASIVGISTGPLVMARTGARRGMLGMMFMYAVGITLVGVGADVFASVPVVLIGMALFGYGNGCVDVMMNVEAAAIEQQMRKTILPVFHGFFSIGTVLGAGAGALAAHLRVNVAGHAIVIGISIAVLAVLCYLRVPDRAAALDPEPGQQRPWRERMHTAFEAWREPRTYLLGVVVLGMAFAEGGANDWIALGTEQGHKFASGTGALSLAVFSVGMTVVRLFGGGLVDRLGRVTMLRVLAVVAASGIVLFVLGPNLPLVLIGAGLWGVGVALGFPLGIAAAADDPAKAAARVSATATIGYIAFLAGPPALGIISEHIGLLNTLFILVALVVASGLFSASARPLAPPASTSPETK